MTTTESPTEKSQLDKFKDAARELECDDDEQRFKERLGKLVGAKMDTDTELRIHLLANASPPWAIDTILLDHEPEVGEQIAVGERVWEVVGNRHTVSNSGTIVADLEYWAICELVLPNSEPN